MHAKRLTFKETAKERLIFNIEYSTGGRCTVSTIFKDFKALYLYFVLISQSLYINKTKCYPIITVFRQNVNRCYQKVFSLENAKTIRSKQL